MAHAHAKVHPFNEAWSSSGEGHDDEEDMDLKQQESTARKLRANSCLHGSGSGNSYTYDRPELPYTAASRSRKSVVLRDLLEDTRDYWGMFYLLVFLLYFIYTVMFIGSNWSENVAVFHAEVMKSMDSYGEVELSDNTHMLAAFKYGTGYISSLVSTSQERNLPDTQLYLGQYTRIQLARIVVDVDSSCKFKDLYCHRLPEERERFGRDQPTTANTSAAPLPSGLWSPLPDPSYFVYGYSSYYYLNLYNISSNTTSFAETQNILEKTVRKDAAFIGRYAISMQLEVVAEYDRQYESDSRVFFGIEWILKHMMYDEKLTNFEFKTTTKTVPLKTSFVHNGSDIARLILLVIYIVWILAYLYRQVDEVRLCIRQYRFQAVVSYVNEISRPGLQDHHSDLQALYTDLYHDKSFARSFASNAADALQSDSRQRTKLEKEINKATLTGVWRYCTGGWNIVDIISSLVSFLWAAGWLWVIIEAAVHEKAFRFFLTNPVEDFHALLNFNWIYNSFIFIGILNCLLVGIRLYKYMQFHGGLRVYYSLLSNAWRSIKDFAFWFIYVMMVFGSTVIMVFQISGGNERFALRWEGINSMALVTFGYMDYETFTNQVAGVGGWGPIIIAIFWLAVAILGTVAMNILIAIVGDAYTEAKDKEGPVEFTFVYLCWLRVVWTLIYVRQIWFSWWTEEELVAYWVSIVVNEFNTDPLSATHDFRASRKNPLFTMRISRLFARWGLVLLPEVKTLLTYFSDASNTMLCNRSPWEDGEAVEEMLTDLTCHKRRQRLEAPKQEWTIDKAMPHSTFMMFMMAFGSSGTCGLPQGHGDDIEDISLPSEAKAKKDVENPAQDVAAWRELPLNYNQFKVLADKKFPEQLQKMEAYWFTKSPALYDAYCKGTQDEAQWQAEVLASCSAEAGAGDAGVPVAPDEPAATKPFVLHETSAEFLYQKAIAPLTELLCTRKTAALQILEAFGASSNKMSGLWLLGFRKKRLRWSQEKILRYASWIWEVYATEQLGDEEWAAEMDDVDYKLLELKEWFAAEMEKKVVPARASTLPTRPSAVSRVPSRFGGTKRPTSAASARHK